MLIVDIPSVVKINVKTLGLKFSRPQLENMKKYLTGLIVSDKATISTINSMFLDGKDQSSLNRFLTESGWNEEEVNEKRIRLLQKHPQTRWNKSGVVSIDDSIVHKTGKKIEGVDYVFDHAENKPTLGFDVVTTHYVDVKKDYPLDMRLYLREKTLKENKELAKKFTFKTRITLACELVDEAERRKIPVKIYVFDSWFFVLELTNKVESYDKHWVSRLKSNRLVMYRGKAIAISEFGKQLPDEAFRKIRVDDNEYWTFSKSMKLANNRKKVRIVISQKEKDRSDDAYYLVTDNLQWEAKKIVSTFSLRRPIENFYRDAKQNLGFEKSQLRNLKGIIRHWYMVLLAYSLLKLEFLTSKLNRCLSTIGKACRKAVKDVLESLIMLVYRLFKEKIGVDQVIGMLIKR